MKSKTKGITVKPTLIGMVKWDERRRASEDGRKFVAWMVCEYRYGQFEWRISKEFPVGTALSKARATFPKQLTRQLP